jgi:hypothetical protein
MLSTGLKDIETESISATEVLHGHRRAAMVDSRTIVFFPLRNLIYSHVNYVYCSCHSTLTVFTRL